VKYVLELSAIRLIGIYYFLWIPSFQRTISMILRVIRIFLTVKYTLILGKVHTTHYEKFT